VLAVDNLMTTRLNKKLNPVQLERLWIECKEWLTAFDLSDTVDEVEASIDGHLDTMPRDDLMGALAHVLTGVDWPINASSDKEFETFRKLLAAEVARRGYSTLIPAQLVSKSLDHSQREC